MTIDQINERIETIHQSIIDLIEKIKKDPQDYKLYDRLKIKTQKLKKLRRMKNSLLNQLEKDNPYTKLIKKIKNSTYNV